MRHKEEEFYTTLIEQPSDKNVANARWEHIQKLVEDGSPSHMREAIVEADIMLNDALASRGYQGESIGDKLKSISGAQLRSISDAWEAHKVRNQIAHEGSTFDLSPLVAQRTLAHYETVFKELGVI